MLLVRDMSEFIKWHIGNRKNIEMDVLMLFLQHDSQMDTHSDNFRSTAMYKDKVVSVMLWVLVYAF